MKKYLVLLLGMLLLTSGCPKIQGTQAKTTEATKCNFVGGVGLMISADVPYTTIYAGDTIDFTLHLENRGDAPATITKICIFGVDPSLIESVTLDGENIEAKPCATVSKTLEAAQKVGSNIIPGGTADLDISLGTPTDIKTALDQPVTVNIVYNYSTYVTGQVCIQNLRARVKKPVCKAGQVKDLCVSGGPIELKSIKAYIRKEGNSAKVILTLSFMNYGNGNFYTENQNSYRTTIKVSAKLGGTTLSCGKNGTVVVPTTGEFTIKCTGSINIPNEESFNYGYYLPLEIALNYTYLTTWSYTFEIQPQLE